ncbi:hypothetical protein BJ508DRAFT_70782 [Ascobolus immersus RN42]|uniref:Putative zinc-finger domain-containing protein n=1 Tax=Ascobolus immersus RN42 TaxID=1160509 RepID=A0A3N4INY8_ASCIM|nr:hypothetical protein BJ508DRAFT_70782 [Ascobolus immersus RN42]
MAGSGVAPFAPADSALTSPIGISPATQTHGSDKVKMDLSTLANNNLPIETRLREGRALLRKAIQDIAPFKLTYGDLVREGFSPTFIKGTVNKVLKELGHQPLQDESEKLPTTAIRVTPNVKQAIEKIKEQANSSIGGTDANFENKPQTTSKTFSLPPIPPALNPSAPPFTIPGLQTIVPTMEIPGLTAGTPTTLDYSGLQNSNGEPGFPPNNRKRASASASQYEKPPKRKFGSFVKDPSLVFEVTDDEDDSFTAKRNGLLKEKEKVAQSLQNTEESIRALREQLKMKMTPVTTPGTPTVSTNGNSYMNKGKSAPSPPEKATTPNSVNTPTLEEATAALKREKERLKQEELAKIRARLEETQAQKRKEEAVKAELERQRVELVKAQEKKEAEAAEERRKTEEEVKEREAAEKQLRNERNRQEAEKKREELLAKLKESRENKRRQEEEAKRKQEEAERLEKEKAEKEAHENAKAAAPPAPLSKKEQLRLQLEQMEREDRERQQRRQQMLAQLESMDLNSSSGSGEDAAGIDSSAKSAVVVPIFANTQTQVDPQQPEAAMASEADSDAMDIDEPEVNAPIITTFPKVAEKDKTPVPGSLTTKRAEVTEPEAMVESSDSSESSSDDDSSSESDSGSESDDEQGSGSEGDDNDDEEASSSEEEGEIGDSTSSGGDDSEKGDDMETGFQKSDSPVPPRISNATAEDTIADAQEDLVAPIRVPVPEQPKQEDYKSKFLAYESPLKQFKFYRLTASFQAKDGYRSLTYSNKIDPHKPFCRYETSGGTCKDKKCPNQHFREISKTGGCFPSARTQINSNLDCFPANIFPKGGWLTVLDDDILLELGSRLEGDTDEQKEMYRNGLRDLISHLKNIDNADFDTAVRAIGEYWRVFRRNPIEKPDITKEPFTSFFAKIAEERKVRQSNGTSQ